MLISEVILNLERVKRKMGNIKVYGAEMECYCRPLEEDDFKIRLVSDFADGISENNLPCDNHTGVEFSEKFLGLFF